MKTEAEIRMKGLQALINALGLLTHHHAGKMPALPEVLKAAVSKWNLLPFRPGSVGGHCIDIFAPRNLLG